MKRSQRVEYLDLYRSKIQRELDQMQYGRSTPDLPAATVAQPGRPAGVWAVAITALLIGGIAIGQVL